MLKLQTRVEAGKSRIGMSVGSKAVVLGSCFADGVGGKLRGMGLDICLNPFGTLYNPVSIMNSVSRLSSGIPFTADECVPMGAGAGLVCSFSHHTSFARETAEDFLAVANEALGRAADFWRQADRVIVTLGTSWVFRHIASGEVVSNCLKRDGREFSRERLSLRQCALLLAGLPRSHPDKKFFLTVSPIRHLADGAHGNQLSKSTLLMAVDEVCAAFPDSCEYFPAYEIVLDELRDYRFYAEDMVHPSAQAVDYITGRFLDFAFPDGERPELERMEARARRSLHRPGRLRWGRGEAEAGLGGADPTEDAGDGPAEDVADIGR